ncbi:Hypothetical_protein [Hexamita inflata]|uniref:Hypothetical_protein n=1 Tax=Hexamita inflata TaxID=28002 RepID=A0AA86NFS4_9EUKA|nr:Hypothetical protein HINF_LOCUS6415 [Hexamita inflata]
MLSAQNLYKQQHGEPEIQEKVFKALKDKLDLTFIGCFQYQFSSELKLLQAECYDRTVEKSGAISLNPYSLYEVSEGILYITELVRSDFKGGNFEKNAETILMLNEKLSIIQSKWKNFYSLLSENAPELLLQLPIEQTHLFCQGRSEKEMNELTVKDVIRDLFKKAEIKEDPVIKYLKELEGRIMKKLNAIEERQTKLEEIVAGMVNK